ncbi:MAG TPA: choice-of-anchor Q domain-containing protein, partial [Fimbriiglobus sp.]
SLFDNNSSFGPGGAIFNQATMVMRRSSIRNNTGGDGGGIANISDHFSVIDSCDVLSNHGSITGGILAQQTNQGLVINGTTISGNFATGAAAGGAGISVRPASFQAPVDIINCTVSDNFNRIGAAGNAGGIFADPAAIVHISNSILARDFLFDRFQQIPQDCVGAPQSFGHNAIDFLPGCSIVLSTDFVGDPRLGTLADAKPADGIPEGNGAIPLLAGSPMIDWADPGQCQATDQLGFPRADGDLNGSATCDVGALEFEPIVSSVIALVRTQTVHDPKPPTRDFPAGKDTITRQYKNKSSEQIVRPVFVVTTLTDQEMLLNCDPPAPGGVGARLTPDVGTDLTWGPNEIITVTFVIGLKTEANYRFSVDVVGYPQ